MPLVDLPLDQLRALATAPTSVSLALTDLVCPPSTVFAAYHAYGGPAQIEPGGAAR